MTVTKPDVDVLMALDAGQRHGDACAALHCSLVLGSLDSGLWIAERRSSPAINTRSIGGAFLTMHQTAPKIPPPPPMPNSLNNLLSGSSG